MEARSNGGERPLQPAGDDFRKYFDEWLECDGYPWWPFWSNVRSWWAIKDRSNVHLVHYRHLIANLSAEIRRVADFLGIDVDSSDWDAIVDLCTFKSMKGNSGTLFGRQTQGVLAGRMKTFFRKGAVEEWRNILTTEQIAAYEERVAKELPNECAAWLSGQS
jgi:aryl sulfotransferase